MKLLALLLCIPSLAIAEERIGGGPMPFGESAVTHYESPQRFAIEIKFTPYTPHIDQSKGLKPGATPFSDLFQPQVATTSADGTVVSANKGKQPPYRLLTTVEFDYQFLHRAFGNFGVGLTTGYYTRSTHSFILPQDANGNAAPCAVPNCTRSGDETGLNILPLSALFIYRFDLLAKRYRIPLVPYVKFGLAYYIWWINDGDGLLSAATYPRPTKEDASPPNKQTAYGGTFGFVVHPGIALQLDFIERGVAKTLDSELGINHTYLFCELNYANINGFGASNKMDLSDTMLNAGIGFDF